MSNWKICLSIVIALIAVLMVIDYYHYSPPNLEAAEIEKLAKVQLEKQLSDILSCSRHIKKEQVKACSLKVLDIRELDNKTYLVFKVDYQLKEARKELLSDKRYILGMRLVEKKLGGIALSRGAEFEVKYTGFYPADCGRHDDGIFYGLCKDPRVSKITLRGNDFVCEQVVTNQVIFAKIPAGRDEVYPEFWDNRGQQIPPTNAMRMAFIGGNSQIIQQYNNQPFTGWIQGLDEIDYLSVGTVDAVWIFPDYRQSVLQGACQAKLKELINEGIPVIFVGEKEPQKLTRIFQMEGSCDRVTNSEDIIAVYIGVNKEGTGQIGVISVDEGMQFPILQKSMALRYRLDIFNKGEAKQEEGTLIKL
ncbi:MAG: hypothetical protein KBG91_00645 [Syntrophomonadaceae bacterium]|nr:hypothetical protein [Syntrophomonadaceae bacterium]